MKKVNPSTIYIGAQSERLAAFTNPLNRYNGVYFYETDTNALYQILVDEWVLLSQSLSADTGEIFCSSGGGWPSMTNGCEVNTLTETTTNKQNQWVLAFDPSSVEYAEWTVWMPTNWDGGDFTYQIWWMPGGSASPGETIVGALQCVAYANDDPTDVSWGVAVEVTDTVSAIDDEHYSGVSGVVTPGGNPNANRVVQFRFYRNAVSGSDTMNTADLLLKGIKVFYTKS